MKIKTKCMICGIDFFTYEEEECDICDSCQENALKKRGLFQNEPDVDLDEEEEENERLNFF